MKTLRIAGALLLFIFAFACGRTAAQPTRIQSAYTLLDHGQNASAIVLLESELREGSEHPDEARTLLASAYMGMAGIDIFSIFDAFQSFLFSKSLGDMFLGKGGGDANSASPGAGGPTAVPPVSKDSDPDAPEVLQSSVFGFSAGDAKLNEADAQLMSVDATLASLERFGLYLARFPHVPERQWPLLASALDQLDRTAPNADLQMYKAFIRLIQLKSYLREKVIRDSGFGTRKWACNVELSEFAEPLGYFAGVLTAVSDDLDQAVKVGATKIKKPAQTIHDFVRSPNVTQVLALFNDGSTIGTLQLALRQKLNCVE